MRSAQATALTLSSGCTVPHCPLVVGGIVQQRQQGLLKGVRAKVSSFPEAGKQRATLVGAQARCARCGRQLVDEVRQQGQVELRPVGGGQGEQGVDQSVLCAALQPGRKQGEQRHGQAGAHRSNGGQRVQLGGDLGAGGCAENNSW
jgi:hypothetical protein